jgi:hypothetical protein
LEDAVNVLTAKNAALATASQPSGKPHQSDASDSDDFYNFNETGSAQIQDHLAYLNDKKLYMLDRHVNVKLLTFIRYNTTLLSSARVDRLFSSGAIILSLQRSCLSDTLFEKLLLLIIFVDHCSVTTDVHMFMIDCSLFIFTFSILMVLNR